MISVIPQQIEERTTFIVVYESLFAVLPRPVVLDTKSQQLTRILRENVGLKQCIFRTNEWYGLRIYEYEFRNLSTLKRDDFIELLKTASGDPIVVLDHLNSVKTMYVTEIRPVEEVHDGGCSFSIGVTMQEVF